MTKMQLSSMDKFSDVISQRSTKIQNTSVIGEKELKVIRDKMLNFERFMGNTILTN